jgi:hypothetical protein
MLILGGLGVLFVGIALHIAWVAKRAVARGRNAWAWTLLALVLGGAGMRGGIALFLTAADVDNEALMALFATAPITLALAPMIGIVLVLNILPVHVASATSWPVFAQGDGAGMLVIEDAAIELRWAARKDRFERAGLTATADQESVRLSWADREVLLMPTGKPATRDGRVRQAQAIAARLQGTSLPKAQTVSPERSRT